MSNLRDANCPIIPQCCQPVYGYNYQQSEFLSAAQTASCPVGTTGGPFTVQEGAFFSDTSQADADQQATQFMNSLLTSGCTIIPPDPPQIQFSFSRLVSAIPYSTFQISVDGNPYADITLGTTYSAAHQLKYKIVWTPGTYTGGGFNLGEGVLEMDYTTTGGNVIPVTSGSITSTGTGLQTSPSDQNYGRIYFFMTNLLGDKVGQNPYFFGTSGTQDYSLSADPTGFNLQTVSGVSNIFMGLGDNSFPRSVIISSSSSECILNF